MSSICKQYFIPMRLPMTCPFSMGKYIMKVVIWILWQGFSDFPSFLHNFVMSKLATSSIRTTTIYSDFNNKHMYRFIKLRYWYPYTIPCEWNWGEKKIQLYSWDWHFKKFLSKQFGCPARCILRVWMSKRCPEALLAKTVIGNSHIAEYLAVASSSATTAALAA